MGEIRDAVVTEDRLSDELAAAEKGEVAMKAELESDAHERLQNGISPDDVATLRELQHPPATSGTAIARLAAEAVLESLQRGVIIIDREARVLFANRAALLILNQCDALRLTSDHRVALADRVLQRQFANHVACAVPASAASIAFRVERAGDAAPYRILIALLSGAHLQSLVNGSGPLYSMFVYPSPSQSSVPVKILRDLYGLTCAEAAVTSLLFEGASVREVAARLMVSMNTIRTHLKHVFSKCDVESQAELMQLLALGPRTL